MNEQTAIDGSNNTTTTTSGRDQDEKNTDKSTNETGGQVDKSEEEASTDDKSTGVQADNTVQEEASTTDDNNAGGQANNSTKETPTESKETVGGDDGTAKNQRSFDDTNGSLDGALPVKEELRVVVGVVGRRHARVIVIHAHLFKMVDCCTRAKTGGRSRRACMHVWTCSESF